ncbi:MAG: MFS transporter [Desulfoferrobacter sp.]
MLRDKSTIGVCCSAFFMMLGVGMIVAILPQRVIELTGSVSPTAYLASLFAIPYLLLQIPCGRLSDRMGFKPFIIAGYGLCALAGFIFYFSNDTKSLFFGRMLQGAGEAPIWSLAPALLSLQNPTARGRVMGSYNASIHLGLTAGPALGIAVSEVWQGNQAFLIYAGLCLSGAAAVFKLVKDMKHPGSNDQPQLCSQNLISFAANPERFFVLVAITLYGAGYGLFLTVVPGYLIAQKRFGRIEVGLFFTLFYLAISLSQLFTGVLADRKGERILMICGLLLAVVGVGLFTTVEQPWIIGLLTLASAGLGAFSLSSMTYLNGCISDSMKGTVSGAFYLFWGVGYFAGPLAVGDLGKLAGFPMCFVGLSFLFAANALAIILSPGRRTG